jgi:predicted metal-dependent hydrolase
MLKSMQKQIWLGETKTQYEHKTNRRSRRIRLYVHPGGRVVVTSPPRGADEPIQRLFRQKSAWIISKIEQMKKMPVIDPVQTKQSYLANKDHALALAKDRINYFNQFYNFKVGRVSIKNHKSLWGSCSRKGNLNFNFRIALLPDIQRDYIIVHELCHLAEFNHSVKFWLLVAQTIPNHKQVRRELKRKGMNPS